MSRLRSWTLAGRDGAGGFQQGTNVTRHIFRLVSWWDQRTFGVVCVLLTRSFCLAISLRRQLCQLSDVSVVTGNRLATFGFVFTPRQIKDKAPELACDFFSTGPIPERTVFEMLKLAVEGFGMGVGRPAGGR
jgi:hypothetical protein